MQDPIIVRNEKGKTFIIDAAVTKLNLIGCDITAKQCKIIGEALKLSTSLTKLDLYDNWNIESDGCNWLSKALTVNSSLKTLSLKKSYVGDDGCKYLSRALKVNDTLTKLDLYRNQISSEGCVHLSEALHTNSTLKTLELSTNNIGQEGALAMIEALKVNKTLTYLNLFDNPGIDKELIDEINKQLNYNKQYPSAVLDMTIVLINFARQRDVLTSMLPLELWRMIFQWVNYPKLPINYFAQMFDRVFIEFDKINTNIGMLKARATKDFAVF